MADFIYPSNYELREIERDLMPVLTMDDPIFSHFPLVNSPSSDLVWETYDNITGLQGVRGLDGDPSRVKAIGAKRYSMQPGVYGEFLTIDELELTKRRPLGQFQGGVSITDLVRDKQDQLLNREIMRIRAILWTLVGTGTFSVLGERGDITHTDTFSVQTASRAVDWDTAASSTPLADFRAIQLLSRGSSTQFDAGAKAYMNRTTFNKMLSCTNSNDLAGRRVTGLLSVLNLEEINRIFAGEGLPEIVVFDEGYISDAGVFTSFIADDKVVIMGRRTTGTSLGEYRMTRNANNPNMESGSYVYVQDSATSGNPVPRKISIHRGHNGGPVIYFPLGVVVLSV